MRLGWSSRPFTSVTAQTKLRLRPGRLEVHVRILSTMDGEWISLAGKVPSIDPVKVNLPTGAYSSGSTTAGTCLMLRSGAGSLNSLYHDLQQYPCHEASYSLPALAVFNLYDWKDDEKPPALAHLVPLHTCSNLLVHVSNVLGCSRLIFFSSAHAPRDLVMII